MHPRIVFALILGSVCAVLGIMQLLSMRANAEIEKAQALASVHAHHSAHPMQAAPPADPGTPAAPPPVFIKLGAAPKSVELQITAAFTDNNGGMNFNGFTKGEAGYTIPLGWSVTVVFNNKSAVPHSAVVVDTDKTREIRPAADGPYFKGAASPNPEMGTTTKTETFTFTTEEKGKYAVICGFPGHGLAGHWIRFNVADENAAPTWETPSQKIDAK